MSNAGDSRVKAQLMQAGMVREGDPEGPDADFLPNFIEQIFHHWITPLRPDVECQDVTRALVVFNSDNGVDVRVNVEAEFTAIVGEQAEIAPAENSFVGQIVDLYPEGVDPDLAWTGFCTAQGGRVAICDLRRNRDKVLGLLGRADSFHRSALLSLEQGMLEPAVEHLCTAAELGVMTLIQLDGWNDKKDHKNRRKWLDAEVTYGSTPASFATAFQALMDDRNAARYGEAELVTDAAGATVLADEVRRLIDYAKSRRG
ncbi:hypothetical protein [Micromonospora aurantiaca (nom. illeg.)]|uniref:hypothetical protein n=1 Tax=Micromonospora aurantiaca (nom. illeg.) TaxID=47850 RepID=UPI00365A8D7D